MRKELGTPGALIGMAALVFLFGGLALAIYPGWVLIGKWFDRADAPAWVQAVGSIVAILAAIGIAMWQRHSDRRAEHERAMAAATIVGITVREMLGPVAGALLGLLHSDDPIEPHEELRQLKAVSFMLKGLALPNDEQLMVLHQAWPAAAKDIAMGSGAYRHTLQYLDAFFQQDSPSAEWIGLVSRECKPRFKRSYELLNSAYWSLHRFIGSN